MYSVFSHIFNLLSQNSGFYNRMWITSFLIIRRWIFWLLIFCFIYYYFFSSVVNIHGFKFMCWLILDAIWNNRKTYLILTFVCPKIIFYAIISSKLKSFKCRSSSNYQLLLSNSNISYASVPFYISNELSVG